MRDACRNWILIGVVMLVPVATLADTTDQALADYRAQGAGTFDGDAGRRLWNTEQSTADRTTRSCVSCHGADPTRPGRHVRTDETIKPMAPSINPKRLTEQREIEKWFLRNCKWTFGRECSAQEKGDILSYLRRQ